MRNKGVSITVEQSARDWLIVHGYDRAMGARPMARLIQENIKKPLADELLFGKLANGGHVTIAIRDGQLHFDNQDHREGVC